MKPESIFAAITLYFIKRTIAELVWTTKALSAESCEGEDTLLTWKFTKGNNDTIRQLQWYYNSKILICLYSESTGFYVEPLYEDRIERRGTTDILLKKLTLTDTGEYALYPRLAEEESSSMQKIALSVYGPPTLDCKPSIVIQTINVLFCSANPCGRSHLWIEWRVVVGIPVSVGNDSYLNVNSSWHDKLVLCCPKGPSMRCHKGNQHELCAAITIPSTQENRDLKIIAAVIIIVVLFLILAVSAAVIWHIRRKKKSAAAVRYTLEKDADPTEIQTLIPKETDNLTSCVERKDENLPSKRLNDMMLGAVIKDTNIPSERLDDMMPPVKIRDEKLQLNPHHDLMLRASRKDENLPSRRLDAMMSPVKISDDNLQLNRRPDVIPSGEEMDERRIFKPYHLMDQLEELSKEDSLEFHNHLSVLTENAALAGWLTLLNNSSQSLEGQKDPDPFSDKTCTINKLNNEGRIQHRSESNANSTQPE